MISTYQIKPWFQRQLRPIMSWLHNVGVSPNIITLIAAFSSILIGGLFYLHPNGLMLLVVPFFLLFRMMLNALDGMMAHEYNLKSKLGEVLNEFGDVISDAALYLPLMALPKVSTEIVWLFVLFGTLNEFAGVLAKTVGGERRYDGPMAKSDRALLVGLTLVLLFFWQGIEGYINWVLIIALVLLTLSSITRLRKCI